jgi:hypothetical protein
VQKGKKRRSGGGGGKKRKLEEGKKKRRKKEENFADSIPVVVCTTVQGENIRTIEFLTRHLAYIIRSS